MPRPDYYGNPAGRTDDVEVVRAIYAAFNARDVEAALPHTSPRTASSTCGGTAAVIGRPDPYRGHDGMREYFADVARAWDELTIHAEDFRAIPGTVIVMGYVDARRDGAPGQQAVWTWKVGEGKGHARPGRVPTWGPHQGLSRGLAPEARQVRPGRPVAAALVHPHGAVVARQHADHQVGHAVGAGALVRGGRSAPCPAPGPGARGGERPATRSPRPAGR